MTKLCLLCSLMCVGINGAVESGTTYPGSNYSCPLGVGGQGYGTGEGEGSGAGMGRDLCRGLIKYTRLFCVVYFGVVNNNM